jgi:Bifunctional DNA primase/polymerase, N-terminal/Family of unknown function (DUF5906)
MESTVLLFATRFAKEGYFVFPLYSSSKGPQKPFGWARNKVGTDVDQLKVIPATDDISFIEEWPERIAKAYNAKLVGYGVMGLRCVIFDLDVKDGKDGAAEFRKLQTKHGIPRPEFVVKSKSGGYHLYYARPAAIASMAVKTTAGVSVAGTKYPGVDIRGDGGMVIGPLSECSEEEWVPGNYSIIKGSPKTILSELSTNLVIALSRSGMAEDPQMAALVKEGPIDEMEMLKRGEVPPKLSAGNRNNGFYIFLNALRNKGFSASTAKQYANSLVAVTEESDTLSESVNIDEMIERIWKIDLNNPYDVVRDIIERGLYRLTSYKSKLTYLILADNPYIESRGAHDIGSMKQLLARYTRTITLQNGKNKIVNPADLIDGFITSDREVSTIGFKPGASEVFTLTAAEGGRRYLNTWADPRATIKKIGIDETIWEEFKFIVGRIFGPEGSDEYQLGLDFPAWILQKPGIKPVIAPFIMSQRRGVGKSLYFDILQHSFGYSRMGDLQARSFKVDEIVGRFFNPSGSSLLMFDEVQFPVHRNMRQESASFWKHLKTLVTKDNIPVEIKGGDTYQMPNFAGIIMAGNTGNNFPLEEFDRRIWLIDNEPPELQEGLVDRFFMMTKNEMGVLEKQAIINTILYKLSEHKIKLNLDRMRAPMNAVKREMYLSTLSDIEEWWITYFDDVENLLAATPILTKSAIIYIIGVAERLMNSRWREDPEGTFRELKRRGLIHPIRIQGNPYQSRNIRNVPIVKYDGTVMQDGDGRDVLYTSRQHGEFNAESNEALMQMFFANMNTISKYKKEKMAGNKTHIGNSLS